MTYKIIIFITYGISLSGDFKIIAINAATGAIDYTYKSPNYETFGLEYGNGKIYSLVKPYNGGDASLLAIDIYAGTESVIKTYLPSELDDYN
ncbi:MAG: hypothetical protein H0X62_06195 [Bacteroidetes bacterium]|nr:hypothetical protein [Bacteroidota bacterium]